MDSAFMLTGLTEDVLRRESTDVRFNTRTLLLVMAVLALCAALVGPYVRGLQPEEQVRALVACGVWLTMITAWIFLAARRRFRIENLAGKALLRLPIYGVADRWRRVRLYVLSTVLASYGLVCLFVVAEQAIRAASIGRAIVCAFHLPSLVMAALAAQSVALWWWSDHARLSEAGILWDRRLVGWTHASCSWDSEREVLTFFGHDQHGADLRCDVGVSLALHETVEAILKERLPEKSGVAAAAKSSKQVNDV
jgi:hypothetical protein